MANIISVISSKGGTRRDHRSLEPGGRLGGERPPLAPRRCGSSGRNRPVPCPREAIPSGQGSPSTSPRRTHPRLHHHNETPSLFDTAAWGRLDPLDISLFEEVCYSTKVLGEILASIGRKSIATSSSTPPGLGMITRARTGGAQLRAAPPAGGTASLRCITQTLRVISHVRERENRICSCWESWPPWCNCSRTPLSR